MAFIIYLNGVSSCGKTSVCKEMLSLIDDPAIHLSLDMFHEALSDQYRTDEWTLYRKECAGLHRTARVWHDLGLNVIIDNVLETDSVYEEAREQLPDAMFVGIHAPLQTLLDRENSRGRGHYDLVRTQFKKVHKNRDYDLECNSQAMTASDIAKVILNSL